MNGEQTRRQVLTILAALGVTGPMAMEVAAQVQSKSRISVDILKQAQIVAGETYSEDRLKIINTALQRNLDQFQAVRDFEVDDMIEPAPMFVVRRYER